MPGLELRSYPLRSMIIIDSRENCPDITGSNLTAKYIFKTELKEILTMIYTYHKYKSL